MTESVFGDTAAPHPSARQKFTLTVDGSGGTFNLDVTVAGGAVTHITSIAFNVSTGALTTALEAAADGVEVTVTGGVGAAGGGTPYVIQVDSPQPILLSCPSDSLTGGAGTATVVQSQEGARTAVNRTVARPGGDAKPTTAAARPRNSFDITRGGRHPENQYKQPDGSAITGGGGI